MPQIYNLPGTSNNVNIKELIDKLVKAESKRIDVYENEKDFLDKKKSALVELNNKLKKLEDAAKNLYGFRSPFEDKIAKSSNSDVLVATATRVAVPSTISIKVLQLAQSEIIVSDSVPDTKIFEPGILKIGVGDRTVDIEFDGGNLNELAEAINRNGKDLLIAKVAKNAEDTSVLILETKNTGKSYEIGIDDKSTLKLFEKIGLFQEKKVFSLKTEFEKSSVVPYTESAKLEIKNGILSLFPNSRAVFKFEKPVPVKDSIYISVKIRAAKVEEAPPKPVKWPELKGIGSVKVKDIEIEGGKPLSKLPQEKVRKKPVIDNGILGVRGDGELIKKDIEGLDSEFKEYRFKITDLVKNKSVLNEIFFVNDSTNRRIEYKDFKIIDTETPGGISPKHLVQEPKNSIIEVDGVKVERDSNEIKDVLKGVTLNLLSKSDKKIDLTIDYDYEKITKKIVDLIEKYNDAIRFINEKTKISASGNLTEKNKVGILSGDITVSNIKNKLQLIMMNPYPTDKGKELNLLAQIGISMGKGGSSWNDIKSGYLQIDEDKFIEAFRKYPDAIKQLFGSDTNRDMIIDNGVAYTLDKTLKGYTDLHQGIITYRIKNTDTQIKEQDKKIEDWNEHLEEYRKTLERKFTVMQEAMHELERNRKSIENFNKQMGGK